MVIVAGKGGSGPLLQSKHLHHCTNTYYEYLLRTRAPDNKPSMKCLVVCCLGHLGFASAVSQSLIKHQTTDPSMIHPGAWRLFVGPFFFFFETSLCARMHAMSCVQRPGSVIPNPPPCSDAGTVHRRRWQDVVMVLSGGSFARPPRVWSSAMPGEQFSSHAGRNRQVLALALGLHAPSRAVVTCRLGGLAVQAEAENGKGVQGRTGCLGPPNFSASRRAGHWIPTLRAGLRAG